ncbi:Root cap protein [Dioscorea alata]|uniref:Root cap protein n=1 Tax=Dioscorea alata TaxID=55571 RepID=A0ACB7VZP1_DIOAL|nr:Root cap protein [Dioscorea alata]
MFLIACTTRVAGFQKLYPRKVRCRLSYYPKCYFVSLPCPPQCPQSCLMDCTLCKPICQCNRPGAVCQDPRFIGGDGITFYFHGRKDKDFCLLFIGAKMNTTLWDDTIDQLELYLNEHSITLPSNEGAVWESMSDPRVFITRTRVSNGVKLEVEGKVEILALVVPVTQEESKVHKYNVGKDESLAHLDLGFKLTYRKDYKSRAKMGVAMPVLGGDREFVSSGLFSTDCLVSQFNGTATS